MFNPEQHSCWLTPALKRVSDAWEAKREAFRRIDARPATATVTRHIPVYDLEGKRVCEFEKGRDLYGEVRPDDFFYFSAFALKNGQITETECRLPVRGGGVKIERECQ